MALLVLDRIEEDRLIRERRENGLDRYDEVWEGMYVMAPLANLEHQTMIEYFTSIFRAALGWNRRVVIHPGANVSDREEGWAKNYRVPDITVTLPEGLARFCGTHWVGGPDFVVEVVSEEDRSRDKLEFYGQIGVREVLIVDRDPWSLELYRLIDGEMTSVGTTAPGQAQKLASEVLPVSFRLVEDPERPILEVTHADGVQSWSI